MSIHNNHSDLMSLGRVRHALKQERLDQIVEYHTSNPLKNIETFEAICLSGAPEAEQSTEGSWNPIKIRPLKVHDVMLPDPCDSYYSDENLAEEAARLISLHPTAVSVAPLRGGQRTPGFGERITCEWTKSNVGVDGKMRGVRYFYPNSEPEDYNFVCANKSLEQLKGQFLKKPYVTMANFVPDVGVGNPPSTLNYTPVPPGPCNPTTKQQNIGHIEDACDRFGITNVYARIAILSVVRKESNLCPKSEKMNYSAGRLAEVWSRFSTTGKTVPKGQGKKYANALAYEYAKDDAKLANLVYAGKYGNRKGTSDGWDYRGRGFNQITFRGSYEKYAKIIGIDIVANPDLLNQPIPAANAVVAFIQNRLKSKNNPYKQYRGSNPSFANQTDANLVIARANAGWGKGMGSSATKRAIKNTNSSNRYFSYDSSTGKITFVG